MKMTIPVLVLAGVLCGAAAAAQVPYERIVKAESEPANWLTYAGSYKSQRYTQLEQITAQNVSQLKPAWVYQIRTTNKNKNTPNNKDDKKNNTKPPSTVTA